jgi:hypothetical protein
MNRYDDMRNAFEQHPSGGGKSVVTITLAFAMGIGLGLGAVYLLRTMRQDAPTTPTVVAPAPAKSSLGSDKDSPIDDDAIAALVGESSEGDAVSDFVVSEKPKSRGKTKSSGRATGKRTLEYWNLLNSIMTTESTMRTAPPSITAGNAQAFVTQRSQAFEFAARTISALDTRSVDEEVVGIGREIAQWYQSGVTANANAQHLLAQADEATRKGAAGKSWRSSEEQHRQQCLEINRKGAEVRGRMSAKYGQDFPPLK